MQRLGTAVAQPKAARDGVHDEVGVADRGKIDEDDPVEEVVRDLGRGRNRQTRLADATGTGQGQQADSGITHQRNNGRQFLLSWQSTVSTGAGGTSLRRPRRNGPMR